MNRRGMRWVAFDAGGGRDLVAPTRVEAQATKYDKPQAYQLTAEDRQALAERTAELEQAVAKLPPIEAPHRDALADVAVYAKAGAWAIRFGEFYTQKDVAMTLDVLKRGLERARALAGGRRPWAEARGESIRGYESKVDGSFQPYSVIVPDDVAGAKDRVRLDVVLHGRGATLNEARFIAAHDGKPAPADAAGKITLHVFGRTNNAYRWAGEADVFEAIEAVKRNYSIDERRIVLRGFSMGGAGPGTWAFIIPASGPRSRPVPASPRRSATPSSRTRPSTRKRPSTSTTPSITPETPSTSRSPATAARTTPSGRRRSTSRTRSRRSATR